MLQSDALGLNPHPGLLFFLSFHAVEPISTMPVLTKRVWGRSHRGTFEQRQESWLSLLFSQDFGSSLLVEQRSPLPSTASMSTPKEMNGHGANKAVFAHIPETENDRREWQELCDYFLGRLSLPMHL